VSLSELNYYGKHRQACVFTIDFLGEQLQVFSPEEATKAGLLLALPTRLLPSQAIETTTPLFWEALPPPLDLYQKAYTIAHENLMFGNSYLLNLSAPTEISTNRTLEHFFHASAAKYKVLWKNDFVCFSPETFVRIQGGKIFSHPMKGTIDASLPNAATTILQDTKELAEHYTIVDLIRNDLSQVAKRVRVARFRYIDTIQTHAGKALLQVSSEIIGDLPANYHAHLGDILARLLPAGSITGAPKRKTISVIQEAESVFSYQNEPYQRGFYTGICGYFDGQNLDTGVMIRFLERIGEKFYFKSGGGITTQSTLENEYRELIQKVHVPIVQTNNGIKLL